MLWQQQASKKLGSGQHKAGNVSGAKKKKKTPGGKCCY